MCKNTLLLQIGIDVKNQCGSGSKSYSVNKATMNLYQYAWIHDLLSVISQRFITFSNDFGANIAYER